jgi:hypothetical protein
MWREDSDFYQQWIATVEADRILARTEASEDEGAPGKGLRPHPRAASVQVAPAQRGPVRANTRNIGRG